MTPHEQALLLRLAAAELTNEPHSIFVLRRMLADLGWTDAGMDAAIRSLRAALSCVSVRQADLFLEAA